MKPIAEEVLTSRDEVDSIEHKAKPYLAGGGLSRLTELAMEVVKVWRRPAASLLRLPTVAGRLDSAGRRGDLQLALRELVNII